MNYGTAQHAAAHFRREAAERAEFYGDGSLSSDPAGEKLTITQATALALLLDNGGGCKRCNNNPNKQWYTQDCKCPLCHGTGIAPDTLAALQAAGYTKGENDG